MTEAADKDLKNLFHVFRDRKENINKQKINGGAKKEQNGASRDGKNIVFEMKILLNGINGRLDTAEEKISELEGIAIGSIQNEVEKKTEENEKSLSDLMDNISLIHA